MLRLHSNVYAMPAGTQPGPERELRGVRVATVVGDSNGQAGGPPLFVETLPISFEQMQNRLAELPRCDCEPDGFFLLTGHTDSGEFWRLNGHMQEYQPDGAQEPAMHRVELSGECPAGCLDMVLRTLGWPEADLAFELVQEGVTLGEAAFRDWAQAVDR